ncbi:MAG: hypothetical protein JEY91_05375 [Spirochaetaceae bacterium]|nr:hypothetical protein [Spirochaetaceae bacterium]
MAVGSKILNNDISDNPGNDIIPTGFPIGVNVSWFNTWNESQPLANVALSGRGYPNPIAVDSLNQPDGDFDLVLYEGNTPGGEGIPLSGCSGGAQTGLHQGRFIGQATLSGSGGTISDVVYNAADNTTTFNFTTVNPGNSFVHFSNTRRNPSDTIPSGIKNLEIMRPGHTLGDLLNSAFTEVMTPFSAFRVGPNWDWTYELDAPVWGNRAKPGGMYTTTDGTGGDGAPWEILIAMANELEVDLWICLPPNGDEAYMEKIFQTFYFGSDGVDPYSSVQSNPAWAPLDKERSLYFEIGNEIWNWAYPYNVITQQMLDKAEVEVAGGDPDHLEYAGTPGNSSLLIQRRKASLTAKSSEICRSVVGDENMMTRFRPVLSGQNAQPYLGALSLSYMKCVLGGYDWFERWHGDEFPGEFNPEALKTPEDGVSINEFGNVAQPISYWIYGYAVAPYLNGETVSELRENLNSRAKENMSENIDLAELAGVKALAYEGGIETYHSYNEVGMDTVMEEMLNYWYNEGGELFMYYSLAGNVGSGLIPDMTRQDPASWPKLRAIYNVLGLSY